MPLRARLLDIGATDTVRSETWTLSKSFRSQVLHMLEEKRHVNRKTLEKKGFPVCDGDEGVLEILSRQVTALIEEGYAEEARSLQQVMEILSIPCDLGGIGLTAGVVTDSDTCHEALFLIDAWLEALKSKADATDFLTTLEKKGSTTRPMTLAEKIFSQHVLGESATAGLAAGDVVRVGIDWILASELSWMGMARVYEQMGKPGIWRNDRFWLAGDHVVHPKIMHVPKIKAIVAAAEKAKKEFKMTDYQGMNYTIMHTEFVRERAQPGMLCLGSDSHSCSAGAIGCLSIGLGSADVMMALSLGETWMKIPESIYVDLVGKPNFGISGKDVILHILKDLKRNTVANNRIVEFSPTPHLSCDARFAICNMCTEFGAITGLFIPDEITKSYINRRKTKLHKSSSLYFKPDDDARYAGRYEINLSQVEPTVAIYPDPDNVVPISKAICLIPKLDGVFIGACTTTEEELVLAALVLKVGLEMGLPLASGKRHYVPGSLPIVAKLRTWGLLDIFTAAGFTRGPPGCSFCVGLSAEKAEAGETWLSSQNRNFQNRMGTGSFGHLSSAVVCAASSFNMSVTDPARFVQKLDVDRFHQYMNTQPSSFEPVTYVEPDCMRIRNIKNETKGHAVPDATVPCQITPPVAGLEIINSKIVTLGDYIDTDALAPGYTLTTCKTDEEFGDHVLEQTHPEFRDNVRSGHQVVVAGHAFGVGSSREVAVSALKGAGVKAVIARSFAFIYGRNQPSLGMLGIAITDDAFFALARDGTAITIDVPRRIITLVDGAQQEHSFLFVLSEIEYALTLNNGITDSFAKYGKALWRELTTLENPRAEDAGKEKQRSPMPVRDQNLLW